MQRDVFYELTMDEKLDMEGGIIKPYNETVVKLGLFVVENIVYDFQVEYISNFNDTVTSVGRTDLLKEYPVKPELR